MNSKLANRAIIALGSNTDDGESMTDRAVDGMACSQGVQLVRTTRRVWTEPIAVNGVAADSHRFLNSLVSIITSCSLEELDTKLKQIETKLGATRRDKQNGTVVIDLDILAYNGKHCHEADWNRDYIQTLIQELI